MFNMNSIRNDVNGTGTPCEGPSSGRSFVAQQHEPGRNPTTARKTWSKNDNKLAMMSYFKSEPLKRGYRKRMLEIWKEIGGLCKMQVKLLQVTAAGHREGTGLIGCTKEFCCV